MIVPLECGCVVNDKYVSTVHNDDGRHYPLGTSPLTYCRSCDLYRPCGCDRHTSSNSAWIYAIVGVLAALVGVLGVLAAR